MAELILYHRPMCLYCWKVQRAAEALGVELQSRNIWADSDAASTLLAATGKSVVPVLRIIDDAGESTWLPESSAIVAYLQAAVSEQNQDFSKKQ